MDPMDSPPNCSECGKPTKVELVPAYNASAFFQLRVTVMGMPVAACPNGHQIIDGSVLDRLEVSLALLVVTQKSLSGKEVRFLRKFLGQTQAGLAELLEVDKQTVGRWERGEVSMPATVALRSLVTLQAEADRPGHPGIAAAKEAIQKPARRSPSLKTHTISASEMRV
jgi:DNA-binding transcriptional regulator YiaG